MIFSMNSSVFAATKGGVDLGPSGDSMTDKPITIEEQENAVLNDRSLSYEEKTRFLQRIQEHKDLINGDIITPQVANDPSGSIAVPYFKQDNSYYCGPATTKQTVHFIKRTSSSQATIATAIGTTTAGSNLTDMMTYINNNQTRRDYIIVTNPSEDLIQSIVEYSVRNLAPTVCRLKIATGGNWLYSSSGHYMNLSAFTNYGANIQVCDPYLGWVTSTSTGKYYVTSNEIYTATANHFAHQIMY